MKYQTFIKNTLLSAVVLCMSQSASAVSDEEFQTLQEQFNQLADQVEKNSSGNSSDTTVGGYGELHYNNVSNSDNSKEVRQLDLHRFVLFVNHEFNDDVRFYSLNSKLNTTSPVKDKWVKSKSNRCIYNSI